MLSRTKLFFAPLAALLILLAVPGTAAAQETLEFDAALAGGTAPISVNVYENPNSFSWGATVLAVHGFTGTASTWEPMSEAIFNHPTMKWRVHRVIAVDITGHGNSPIPTTLGEGQLFGNLTIYDNVSVVIQTIEFLRAQGMAPGVLMGHSMGGLAVQSVQETLLASGSSLADLGVRRAILLAPVPVVEIAEWGAAGDPLPVEYYRFDNGTYIVLDELGALFGGGFTTTSGDVTPAAFGLDLTNYIGAEPSVTAAQLVGAIPELPRPSAREGAFALVNGTHLTVVGFSEDVLTPAVLQQPLYEHLIGRRGFAYREVVAPDAVHSMYLTNPVGMLEQLYGLF